MVAHFGTIDGRNNERKHPRELPVVVDQYALRGLSRQHLAKRGENDAGTPQRDAAVVAGELHHDTTGVVGRKNFRERGEIPAIQKIGVFPVFFSRHSR